MSTDPKAADLRVRLLNDARENTKGDYVLYWSQVFRRPHDNAALDFAIERANEAGVPCVFYEAIRSDYPYASDRFHTFVLEAARETAAALEKRGILHVFFLPRTPTEARGIVKKLATRARIVVSDDSPMFIQEHNVKAAAKVSCPFFVVDDNIVVPLASFPKQEWAARTIRPKMHKALPEWLVPLREHRPKMAAPKKLDLPFDPIDFAKADLAKLVAACEIDHAVPAVAEFPGGYKSAEKRLKTFLDQKLRTYDHDRNEPSLDATSHMSPYLHFGMVSARKIALEAQELGKAHHDRASGDAFMEQLLVRRGLAFNYAARCAKGRSFAGLPDWAKATLAKHENDAREYTVSKKDLEDARSPDEIWNAAQLELRARGIIHNYTRMLWGKLVLLWSKHPKTAHETLVYLNDKYALDGRDPDGYSNISWCFGLHDRPWPERNVIGTVRTMSSASTARKYDLDSYLASAKNWRRELGLQSIRH